MVSRRSISPPRSKRPSPSISKRWAYGPEPSPPTTSPARAWPTLRTALSSGSWAPSPTRRSRPGSRSRWSRAGRRRPGGLSTSWRRGSTGFSRRRSNIEAASIWRSGVGTRPADRASASSIRGAICRSKPFEKDDRAGQAAVGFEGVVGDAADALVAEAFVEAGRAVFLRHVEGDEGAAARGGAAFGLLHQRAGCAVAAMGEARHQLGDFGAVRLVRRAVEIEGDGRDQHAVRVRPEHDPPARVGFGQGVRPERLRLAA